MKYHIKDIFGNYKTYDSPSYYTFSEWIGEIAKSVIMGFGGAILLMLLQYLLLLLLGLILGL